MARPSSTIAGSVVEPASSAEALGLDIERGASLKWSFRFQLHGPGEAGDQRRVVGPDVRDRRSGCPFPIAAIPALAMPCRFGQPHPRRTDKRLPFWLTHIVGDGVTLGVPSMCDYSLHLVASRPARVGDKLISTSFPRTVTRGFASVDDRHVAVCLLPGTELAFEKEVRCGTGMVFSGGRKGGRSVQGDHLGD
jgi:hypothetical protein